MQSPSYTTSTSELAALPLRARGVLEIIDAAIKLYKQYFWILMGWSAISIGGSSVGTALSLVVPFGGFISYFLAPLAAGSVACCVAAAVRGQPVAFAQCWHFTKPRYWRMLGNFLLAGFEAGIAMVGLMLICALPIAYAIGSMGLVGAGAGRAGGTLAVAAMIFGILAVATLVALLMAVVFTWAYMVPIVVAMEADQRGTQALRRAYDLLRGHWLRVSGMVALLGLALIALMAIVAAPGVMIKWDDIQTMFHQQTPSDTALVPLAIGVGLTYVTLWMLWMPAWYLILTLFYLDIRVRKEALDLEWAAHVQPPATPVLTAAPMAMTAATGPTSFGAAATDYESPAYESPANEVPAFEPLESRNDVPGGAGVPPAPEGDRPDLLAATPPLRAGETPAPPGIAPPGIAPPGIAPPGIAPPGTAPSLADSPAAEETATPAEVPTAQPPRW